MTEDIQKLAEGYAQLMHGDPAKYPGLRECEKFDNSVDDFKAGFSACREMEGEWVSVKETEPDEITNYLWCRVPVVEPPYCGCVLDEDFEQDYYTHYMILPSPPKPNDHE